MNTLTLRVVSGTILLALVLAAIWVGGLLLMALVGLAAALAAHEFYFIVRRAGYAPWYAAGIALSLLLALRGYLEGDILDSVPTASPGMAAELAAMALVLVLVFVRQGYFWWRAGGQAGGASMPSNGARSPHLAWSDLGLTLGGALYTGGLLGYAPLLSALPAGSGTPAGSAWLLMVLLGTAACDTGAYFVGSAIGKHKLIPHISPGKTWEGLLGGALGGVIAAFALSGLLRLELWQALILGLLVCAASVLGDLAESLLKRAVGVKDSGNLIPGHGGILDRIDSILFVLVVVYFFTQVL